MLEPMIESGTESATEEAQELITDTITNIVVKTEGKSAGAENLEQVSVVDESNPNAAPRVAKLIPVPGSPDSFYLSYDGKVKKGDPIYKFPPKGGNSKGKEVEPSTKRRKISCSSSGQVTNTKGAESEEAEASSLEFKPIHELGTQELQLSVKTEDIPSIDAFSLPGIEDVANEEECEDNYDEEEEEDFFDDPGFDEEDEEDGESGELPDNLKAKIDQVSAQSKLYKGVKASSTPGGSYKFSGTWKKPPKQEDLVKTRLEVLQQILEDYKNVCKVCFNGEHEETVACPLSNPDCVVENCESQTLRYGMPDDIVFGTSRVYPGQDSLFSRDEIPAYTQFGPLKGKVVTMQDLATMGVVRNDVDVGNLWPLPIENGQHEFDFQLFTETGDLQQSNWLKFIKVESSKEEHPPYNIQTVYRGNAIYFVTTSEIEPGGELFLRPFEPPFRVYYNMHRLHQTTHDLCKLKKCKPEGEKALKLYNLVNFVKHQLLVHSAERGEFKWAAILNCGWCTTDCFFKKYKPDHIEREHSEDKLVDNTGDKKDNGAVFQCRFCNKVLKTKYVLYSHVRLYHAHKSYESICSVCGKIFKNPDYLREHMNIIHVEDPTPCPVCGKVYRNLKRMNSHKRSIHKVATNQCPICPSSFKRPRGLKEHLKWHSRKAEKAEKLGIIKEGTQKTDPKDRIILHVKPAKKRTSKSKSLV